MQFLDVTPVHIRMHAQQRFLGGRQVSFPLPKLRLECAEDGHLVTRVLTTERSAGAIFLITIIGSAVIGYGYIISS